MCIRDRFFLFIIIIAGVAASEVEGIASMVNVPNGSLLGKKRDVTKGVKVEIGTEEASVDLYVIIEYGTPIQTACQNVQEGVRKAIETIRPIAPDTWILVGGVRYNAVTSVPTLDMPCDDKIVYNFHCYEPLIFTHQAAPWIARMPHDFHIAYPLPVGVYAKTAEEVGLWQAGEAKPGDDELIGPEYFEKMFMPAIRTAEERNVPLYCGEYGVIDLAPAPDTLRWLKDINAAFAKYGIGRALWTYKVHSFGLVDAHYDDIREEMIKVL